MGMGFWCEKAEAEIGAQSIAVVRPEGRSAHGNSPELR
jgi:hypothetical protein